MTDRSMTPNKIQSNWSRISLRWLLYIMLGFTTLFFRNYYVSIPA